MAKVRLGFVSNSSSSSFCIYGALKPFSELTNLEDSDDIQNFLDNISGVTTLSDFDDECAYIGLSYEMLKDDETGLQFKERTREALVKAFGDKAKDWKLDYINEEIYN